MRDVSANSVLLVDDDPTIRKFLSSQLEEAGFKAEQAEDGIDGLVKLRDKLPKVIISVGAHLKTYKFEQRPVFRGGVGCQPVVTAVLPVAG
jgi:ActR/RegA family two-component response regulator